MRLGPESRRQVGDNFEGIINQLLSDFGWTNVRGNYDINVPEEVRVHGQQGADAAYVYHDPTTRSDIGVHVESKKCRNMSDFRAKLLGWLKAIDDAVGALVLDMYRHPFEVLSTTGSVDIQEAILSVWIDEFDEVEFNSIVKERIQEFARSRRRSSRLTAIHIFGNTKLLQLQSTLTHLRAAVPRLNLSGNFQFEYPRLGGFDSPNLSYLSGDNLFISAFTDQAQTTIQLLAFFMGTTSIQQLRHVEAVTMDVFGQLLRRAQGLHAFVWDLVPSDPENSRLWDSMFRRSIQRAVPLRSDFVTVEGINRSYLSFQG